jgi:hypothetical protein
MNGGGLAYFHPGMYGIFSESKRPKVSERIIIALRSDPCGMNWNR